MSALPRQTEAIRLASALGIEFGAVDVMTHRDGSMTVSLRHDSGDYERRQRLYAVVRREMPGRLVLKQLPRRCQQAGREWASVVVAANGGGLE